MTFFSTACGEIGAESLGQGVDFGLFHGHGRYRQLLPAHRTLDGRYVFRFDGLDQREELLGDVLVGVVEHRSIDEVASEEPFLCMRMKSPT